MECSQAVRHKALNLACVGSNPTTPTNKKCGHYNRTTSMNIGKNLAMKFWKEYCGDYNAKERKNGFIKTKAEFDLLKDYFGEF